MSDATVAKAYVITLIVGVVLLYGFWQIVILLASNISQTHKYGIAIVLAIAVALVNTVRVHSRKLEESRQ